MGIRIIFSCLAAFFILMPNILSGQENRNDSGNSPGTFVLAVPRNSEFAVDTAMALEKIRRNREPRNSPVNITVVFTEGPSHEELRKVLARADLPENWVCCYLDAGEAPEDIVIRHGGWAYLAPLDLVKPLPSLFRSRQIPWSFKIRYNEIFKLGLAESPEPVSIARDQKINSIVLSGGKPASSGETVSPGNLAELLADYACSLSLPALNEDRHYSMFSLPGGYVFFLNEGNTAALLIISLAIFLFLFLIFSIRHYAIFIFHIRLFLKYSWIIIVLFFLLVFSIKSSFFLCSLLQPLLNTLAVSVSFNRTGFAYPLAAVVFLNLARILDLVIFPRKEQIFGFAALVLGLSGMIYAAFQDLSYVPFFLWTFLFIFMGASARQPKLVYICTFLVPLNAIGILCALLHQDSSCFAVQFFDPGLNTGGNGVLFYTAFFSLPLYLLAKRGTLLGKRRMRRNLTS